MAEETRAGFIVVRDAAILVAAGTAFLALIGFLHDDAYYGRLGIPMHDLAFPIHHFMTASFPVLLWPAAAFLVYPALEALPGAMSRRRWRGDPPAPDEEDEAPRPYHWLSAPAVLAAVGIMAAAKAFASVGDDSWHLPFWDLTVLDVFTWILGLLMVFAIVRAQRMGKRSSLYTLLGKTKSAKLALAFLAITSFAVTSASAGADEASAAAWGCVPLPTVTFEPLQPGLNASHAYWLVLRIDGNYIVRDKTLNGTQFAYEVVPEGGVARAHVERLPAVLKC